MSAKKGMKNETILDPLITVGWREWISLPNLGIPAIKAKIDTGARTSSLHAFEIKIEDSSKGPVVRFGIHPLQKQKAVKVYCSAQLIERRYVTDSGGHREKRYVIETLVNLGGESWPVELTLTNRESMRFRMLLGRTAMMKRLVVDPSRSFMTGRALASTYGVKKREKGPGQ